MISKADHIEDMESPVDETDKVAKISPRAEIEGHEEQCDKQENGSNLEGKNEEENSGESKKEDTEKGDVFSETLEIAYDLSIAQKNATSNHCDKCDITFKSKKK